MSNKYLDTYQLKYYDINLRETLYKFIEYLKDNSESLDNKNINDLTLDISNKHYIKFNTFLIYLKLENYENKIDDYLSLDYLDIFEETYLFAIEFLKLGEKQKAQEQLDIAYSYIVLNPIDFD
jgi:hypothetical protein